MVTKKEKEKEIVGKIICSHINRLYFVTLSFHLHLFLFGPFNFFFIDFAFLFCYVNQLASLFIQFCFTLFYSVVQVTVEVIDSQYTLTRSCPNYKSDFVYSLFSYYVIHCSFIFFGTGFLSTYKNQTTNHTILKFQ